MSEQEDEMMSLEAIYGEDYVAGSATSFRVRIQPSLGGQAEKVWVSCTLEVEYTPGYPGDLAVLRLTDVVGLSALQCGELEGRVGATALELQGGPCVYGVVECVREWLSERNVKPSDGSAFDEMMREKRAKEAPVAQQGALSREMDPSIKNKAVSSSTEEDEGVRRRRDGTPVTPESFAKWSAAFEAEMAKVKEEEEAAARKAEGSGHKGMQVKSLLTGKQLFESGAAGGGHDVKVEGMEDAEDVDFSKLKAVGGGGGGGGEGGGGGGGGDDDDDEEDEDWEEDSDGEDDTDDEEDGEEEEEEEEEEKNKGGGGGGRGGKKR